MAKIDDKFIKRAEATQTANDGKRIIRTAATNFQTREEGGNLYIEGYFAVFDSIYEIAPDMSESIAPGAFSNTLSEDIRALINHDTTLVLGRNKAGTLELREDERGLWGKILINPKDQDAMNLYERVKRGDVDQCSFGFYIVDEASDYRADGTVHWTIKEVKLFEVSCCTFPAYEDTSIQAIARGLFAQYEALKEEETRKHEAWKHQMKERLK